MPSIVRSSWQQQRQQRSAVFAEFERDILRDRVKAGIAQARQEGRPHGRPVTVRRHADDVRKLHQEGVSKSEIARRLSRSAGSWDLSVQKFPFLEGTPS